MVLVAPSPFVLRHMLDACSQFGWFHTFVLNATKTQITRCGTTTTKISSLARNLDLQSRAGTDMIIRLITCYTKYTDSIIVSGISMHVQSQQQKEAN